MDKRVYNFSAGPAALPIEVLKRAQKELLSYDDSGISVLEMSHRSKMFTNIIEEAEKSFRKLLNIPDNYKVLFMQGGGTTQFSCIPLHFLKNTCGVVHTGHWTKKAMEEAKKYGNVKILASSSDRDFKYIPDTTNLDDSDVDYVYYCDNNTIYGTKHKNVPVTNKPLICDMSSCICSEEIDVSKYALIFCGAQKNIGPAGVTIVIIREDLIKEPIHLTPVLLKYKTISDSNSLYNTPPCFSIYICKLVFDYLLSIGGIKEIERRNKEKAKLLYDYLDSSKLFYGLCDKEARSMMNVVFTTGSDTLDEKFVKEAQNANLYNLKGHKVLKGLRASIYNAMNIEGVRALVDFMKKFEGENNV